MHITLHALQRGLIRQEREREKRKKREREREIEQRENREEREKDRERENALWSTAEVMKVHSQHHVMPASSSKAVQYPP